MNGSGVGIDGREEGEDQARRRRRRRRIPTQS